MYFVSIFLAHPFLADASTTHTTGQWSHFSSYRLVFLHILFILCSQPAYSFLFNTLTTCNGRLMHAEAISDVTRSFLCICYRMLLARPSLAVQRLKRPQRLTTRQWSHFSCVIGYFFCICDSFNALNQPIPCRPTTLVCTTADNSAMEPFLLFVSRMISLLPAHPLQTLATLRDH